MPVGRPTTVTSELTSGIEARTIQEPPITGESLSREICNEFGVSPSRTAVNVIRIRQHFKYQSVHHDQGLAPWTTLEDEQLFHDYLTSRLKWEGFAKSWVTRKAVQLKICWYQGVKRRLDSFREDIPLFSHTLLHLDEACRSQKFPG
jgi:hypothetical protein